MYYLLLNFLELAVTLPYARIFHSMLCVVLPHVSVVPNVTHELVLCTLSTHTSIPANVLIFDFGRPNKLYHSSLFAVELLPSAFRPAATFYSTCILALLYGINSRIVLLATTPYCVLGVRLVQRCVRASRVRYLCGLLYQSESTVLVHII